MIKSILITGGGSGIGAALAKAMADRGCKVVVSGRRQDVLEAVAGQSSFITPCAADVTDGDDQAALVDALARLPAPRALFHGAGYFQVGRLDILSEADWRRSFDTNVTARLALTTQCAAHLDGGRVLFVGSDSGANVRVGGAAYSVAQAASETLRRALQLEWADRDLAIGAFKPGLVDTDMSRAFLAMSDAEFPARAAFQAYIDRGEFSTPHKVAAFAAWLLLDVEARRFAATDWDIRHADHHPEWLEGALSE